MSVRDFGATGDSVALDTSAIQAAIDACTNIGGGIVYLPPDNYLTGTITLKDNVTSDLRPALVGEDVEDLDLSNFRAAEIGPAALLGLRDARHVYLHGCRPLGEVALFLSVEGVGSQGILLQANDLRRAGQVCTLAEGAPVDAITKA